MIATLVRQGTKFGLQACSRIFLLPTDNGKRAWRNLSGGVASPPTVLPWNNFMVSDEQDGNLLGLNREELENLAVGFGQPRYRGRQIYHGIYARRVRDLAGLTDLSGEFRAALASR